MHEQYRCVATERNSFCVRLQSLRWLDTAARQTAVGVREADFRPQLNRRVGCVSGCGGTWEIDWMHEALLQST